MQARSKERCLGLGAKKRRKKMNRKEINEMKSATYQIVRSLLRAQSVF